LRIIDANLLIYAWDSSSPHHERARTWLEDVYASDDIVGIPRLVALAFVRIVTNPRAMVVAATPHEALKRMDSLINHPKTVVVDAGVRHWSIFKSLVAESGVSGPSMTDAFLAALALEHGAWFCSHDSGFRRFSGLKFENPL
jgi:toxin-antitoxin system PIN domain toxin